MQEHFNLTEEQVEDFKNSLLDRIKSCLKKLFGSKDGQNPVDIQDVLPAPESEAEKEILEKLFDEIDTFHQKRKEFDELQKKGVEIEDWYDDEIRRITKSVQPDASEEDIDRVKEAISEVIDKEIAEEIDNLDTLEREEVKK
jgi:hypothetical protein